ncbi:MAG: hypothetical protein HY042_13140 [Spirochaetia bacterium]|nr:hypothetical protein [Spirochaetia bacterium]
MQPLFKFIDSLTARLPPQVLKFVRLSFVLIWLILATVAVLIAWSTGVRKAPQSGQDLSLSDIRERIQKEKNERSYSPVTIPDLGEMTDEERHSHMPFQSRPLKKQGLSGEDTKLIEPDNMINGSGSGTLPPFMSEDTIRKPSGSAQSAADENPYRKKDEERVTEPQPKKPLAPDKDKPRQEKGQPGFMPID